MENQNDAIPRWTMPGGWATKGVSRFTHKQLRYGHFKLGKISLEKSGTPEQSLGTCTYVYEDGFIYTDRSD